VVPGLAGSLLALCPQLLLQLAVEIGKQNCGSPAGGLSIEVILYMQCPEAGQAQQETRADNGNDQPDRGRLPQGLCAGSTV